MDYRFALRSLLFCLCLVVGNAASATSQFVREIQIHLYVGEIDHAAARAKARLKEESGDDNARFALGAVQFLKAVEQLGQMLHRYGLQSTYRGHNGLADLPILRLPVPDNPKPEELTYEKFRNILKTFVANLEIAEVTLAEIKSARIDLSLDIGRIRLDLNGDGKSEEDEALWRMFAVVAGADQWLQAGVAPALLTDFDHSDIPWLRAYCHLLMAITEFPLAHDWQRAFEATFPSIFHMPSSKTHQPLNRLREIGPQPEDPWEMAPPDMKPREWIKTPKFQQKEKEYMRILELRERYQKRLQSAPIADLIAFVHLMRWPVVERYRMVNVLRHLEAVVGLSRENWKRILAETDNRNEWIPNPSQTGILPDMPVTQDRVDGWHDFLDQFEAILKGNKLIPHWRFDEGLNMRRMFLEPRTFDIVLLLHGSAALPYLEKGPVIDQATWNRVTKVFGGDFFRYFIWFN